MRFAVVLGLTACSSKNEAPPPPQPTPSDAAVIDGITTIGDYDPNSGMHLDEGPSPHPSPKRPARQGVPITIMLKSTPPGATVIVDGENLGATPTTWLGNADGNPHVFSFSKPNYILASYTFVPITSGTLYPTLDRAPIDLSPPDAGLEPDAPRAPVSPPPTVLTPVDAPPSIDAADPMPPEDKGSNAGPNP